MNKTKKVSIFLTVIGVMVIIIAIFARQYYEPPEYYDEGLYKENIQILTDTINELKKDIARYEQELIRIDKERQKLKEEVKAIIKDNDKIDIELSNGDWGHNIEFLTNKLSKETVSTGGHNFGNYQKPDGYNK